MDAQLWIYSKPLTAAATAAKSLQSCPTLCDPIDGSPPGSLIPEILQARTLEWVAISFSKAWKWKLKGKSLSHARLFATPWTAAHQAPPSMRFSRQGYWSGLPFPSPTALRAQKSPCTCSFTHNSQKVETGVGCHCLLRSHWLLYFKWMNCIVCGLYHNTVDFLYYLVLQNKEVSDRRENFSLKLKSSFFSSVIWKSG